MKSVAISIPCVAGPYANVSCTLRLKRHSYRTDRSAAAKYTANPFDQANSRFVCLKEDEKESRQFVVTSSAQTDSGLFETNLHDERYLPFEGVRAISEWSLELPDTFRPFD